MGFGGSFDDLLQITVIDIISNGVAFTHVVDFAVVMASSFQGERPGDSCFDDLGVKGDDVLAAQGFVDFGPDPLEEVAVDVLEGVFDFPLVFDDDMDPVGTVFTAKIRRLGCFWRG